MPLSDGNRASNSLMPSSTSPSPAHSRNRSSTAIGLSSGTDYPSAVQTTADNPAALRSDRDQTPLRKGAMRLAIDRQAHQTRLCPPVRLQAVPAKLSYSS